MSDATNTPERIDETLPRPRPRFELHSARPPAAFLDAARRALESSTQVRGLVVPPSRLELTVPHERRHLWSPQLTVDVVPEGEGARLRARFGPDPHIWTLYVALYSVSVLFAVGCLVYGVSQWVAQQSPWALYLTPLALLFAGLVYGASFVGQGLGSAQMYELRAWLEARVAELDEAPAPPQDAQG